MSYCFQSIPDFQSLVLNSYLSSYSALALTGSTHYLTCFTKNFLRAAILNKRHLSFQQCNLMWFSNDHELLKAVNYCCTVFSSIYSGWSWLSIPAGYEMWTVKKLSSKSLMTDNWNSSFNTSFFYAQLFVLFSLLFIHHYLWQFPHFSAKAA